MTASIRHLDHALAYLFEAQEAAEREGDEDFFVQIRAIKRFAAKAKLEKEQKSGRVKQLGSGEDWTR
jgi:hypothetical protein